MLATDTIDTRTPITTETQALAMVRRWRAAQARPECEPASIALSLDVSTEVARGLVHALEFVDGMPRTTTGPNYPHEILSDDEVRQGLLRAAVDLNQWMEWAFGALLHLQEYVEAAQVLGFDRLNDLLAAREEVAA